MKCFCTFGGRKVLNVGEGVILHLDVDEMHFLVIIMCGINSYFSTFYAEYIS